MSYRVSGNLQRIYLPSIDGYKYTVGKQNKYFKTLEEATTYANKVFKLTRVVLRITKSKSFNRKICIL